jgi:hypothetical protein
MANFDFVRVVVGFGMANNTNRNRWTTWQGDKASGLNLKGAPWLQSDRIA